MNRNKQYIQARISANSTVLVVKILVDLVAVTIDLEQFCLKVNTGYKKKKKATLRNRSKLVNDQIEIVCI
jgi:hypothetical protein